MRSSFLRPFPEGRTIYLSLPCPAGASTLPGPTKHLGLTPPWSPVLIIYWPEESLLGDSYPAAVFLAGSFLGRETTSSPPFVSKLLLFLASFLFPVSFAEFFLMKVGISQVWFFLFSYFLLLVVSGWSPPRPMFSTTQAAFDPIPNLCPALPARLTAFHLRWLCPHLDSLPTPQR